jgi:hypothetical protein
MKARLIRTCTGPRPLDGVGGRLRRLRWCGHFIADLGVVWLDLDDLLPEVLTDEVLDLIDRAERNILRECLAERRKINANVPAAVVGFRGSLPRTDRQALRAQWRRSTRMRQPRHWRSDAGGSQSIRSACCGPESHPAPSRKCLGQSASHPPISAVERSQEASIEPSWLMKG